MRVIVSHCPYASLAARVLSLNNNKSLNFFIMIPRDAVSMHADVSLWADTPVILACDLLSAILSSSLTL